MVMDIALLLSWDASSGENPFCYVCTSCSRRLRHRLKRCCLRQPPCLRKARQSLVLWCRASFSSQEPSLAYLRAIPRDLRHPRPMYWALKPPSPSYLNIDRRHRHRLPLAALHPSWYSKDLYLVRHRRPLDCASWR